MARGTAAAIEPLPTSGQGGEHQDYFRLPVRSQFSRILPVCMPGWLTTLPCRFYLNAMLSAKPSNPTTFNCHRPDSTNFLLAGAQNVNRMAEGFALKFHDAIAGSASCQHRPSGIRCEHRLTTSVVTRAGGNQFPRHIYEFFRNDALDTRNIVTRRISRSSKIRLARRGWPHPDRPLFLLRYLRWVSQPPGHQPRLPRCRRNKRTTGQEIANLHV